MENEDALLVNRIGKIKKKVKEKKYVCKKKKKNVKNCMLCPHLIVRFSDGLKIATSNASKFTSIAQFRKESFFLVDARKVNVELLVAFEAHGLVAHTAAHYREANDGDKRSGVHAQRARGAKQKNTSGRKSMVSTDKTAFSMRKNTSPLFLSY